MERPRQGESVAEFTAKALIAGIAFGVLFGAANAYLGLKAGLTVSTSIPIAVLSAAVFRLLPRGGTLLEANLAQTIGSASSSLASGTIFTIPALFIWGMAPPVTQIALLAMLGGLLGILAMIPLRRLLIVQADAELPYPEGRACAEVLRATEKASSGGRWIAIGIALGFVVKIMTGALHLGPEEVAAGVPALPNATVAIKIAPALLAVGYIVGFRASAVMVSGSLITALVLFPLITKVHASVPGAEELTPKLIRDRFTIYVGAGAVTCAGLFTVFKTAPTMWSALRAVASGLRGGAGAQRPERTDRDLPSWVIVAGLAALVATVSLVPWLIAGDLPLGGRVVAALGVALFGFLFVPVSSRLVGLIGVSSNPTSAMALITIAGTAAVFLAIGWTGKPAMAAVLTVGTIVCVAASKAGDISQDLKTGWLVKGTPALQQFGQLIAAAIACWAVALVVAVLAENSGNFTDGSIAAPQANLMKTVVEAVLGGALPWDLLLSGAALGAVGILAGLPALPFALGVYLPLSTMAAVFLGGVVRRLGDAASAGKEAGASSGILCASGFVAGEGLAGVLIAGYAYFAGKKGGPGESSGLELGLSLALLAICAVVLHRSGKPR